MNLREKLFQYVKKKYNAAPEYLWMRLPEYAVFRHADNGKWFGIIMNVSGEKLGTESNDKVDILNVKLPGPLLAEMLVQQSGFFRGYHISRGNWVSMSDCFLSLWNGKYNSQPLRTKAQRAFSPRQRL